MATITCSKCGASNEPDMKYCAKCGVVLAADTSSQSKPISSRTATTMRTRSVFVIVTAFVIVAVVILAGVLYFRSSATVIANLHSAAYDYTVPCGVAIIGQPVHEGSLNPGEVLPFVLEYHWWGKDPVSITVTAQAGPGENWVLDEENIVVYPGHSYTVDLYL